jgi:hypothetical protein
MDFWNPFTFSGKQLIKSLFENRLTNATCTQKLNTETIHETDRWARDPTRQSQRTGRELRHPQLADGEVSGQARGTTWPTAWLRTQWCTRGGQRSSGDRSPLFMAERWRGEPPAGQLRPRDGARKGARAPVSQGEHDVMRTSSTITRWQRRNKKGQVA